MSFWKEIKKGINKLTGKHKLRKQHEQSMEHLQEQESKRLADLQTELTNELANIASYRSSIEAAKTSETTKHQKEKDDVKVELDTEQKKRKQAFDTMAQNVRNDVRSVKAALLACMTGDIKVLEEFLKTKNTTLRFFFFSLLPLHIAAEHGRAAIVKLLCKHGANICKTHEDGYTAYALAEFHNHAEVMDVLNQVGVETISFWEALQKGDPEAMKAALDRGADINATNSDGYNALQYSLRQQRSLVHFLINAKADPNVVDVDGFNTLQYAVTQKLSFEIINALVESGVDVGYKNSKLNKTAVDLASEHPDSRVKVYLLDCTLDDIIKKKNYPKLLRGGPAWTSDGGWKEVRHNSTIRTLFARVNGELEYYVMGCSDLGMHLHGYNFIKDVWTTYPMGLSLSKEFFTSPMYFKTIRATMVRMKDGTERLFFLYRDKKLGIKLSCFNPNTKLWSSCPQGPVWNDNAGWNLEQHFDTIQIATANVDGEEHIFIVGRHCLGVHIWSYNPNTQKWMFYPTNLVLTEGSLTLPQCYKTLRLIKIRNIDGTDDLYLLIREKKGIVLKRFNLKTNQWHDCSVGPAWTDENGWHEEQHFGTIQIKVARIQGQECLFLAGRHSQGIELWSYNPKTTIWTKHSNGPAWVCISGWYAKCHWSTIQMRTAEGYHGSDYILLFGRASTGILAHAFSPDKNTWITLPFNVPLLDNWGWSREQNYSTIQMHSVRIKYQNHIFVMGRNDSKINTWSDILNLNLLEHQFRKVDFTLSPQSVLLFDTSIKNFEEQSQKLLKASELGDVKQITECLSQGAYINSVDVKGFDALQKAIVAKKLSIELFTVLKKAGIDVNHENANKESTLFLAQTHTPEFAHFLKEDPILGLQESLKNPTTLEDCRKRFREEFDRAQRYLDKYPDNIQKILAMLAYYSYIGKVELSAFYVFPTMYMFTRILHSLEEPNSKENSEVLNKTIEAAQNFFKKTRALHCILNLTSVDLSNEPEFKDFEHVFKSVQFKKRDQELSLKLKMQRSKPQSNRRAQRNPKRAFYSRQSIHSCTFIQKSIWIGGFGI